MSDTPPVGLLGTLIARWRQKELVAGQASVEGDDRAIREALTLARCADELEAAIATLHAAATEPEPLNDAVVNELSAYLRYTSRPAQGQEPTIAQVREMFAGDQDAEQADATCALLGLRTDNPAVIAVMGSQPPCQRYGCQLLKVTAPAPPQAQEPMTMDLRFKNEPPSPNPRIRGRCPSCGAESLFLGNNGYVTCSVIGCKDPGAPTDLLALPSAQGWQPIESYDKTTCQNDVLVATGYGTVGEAMQYEDDGDLCWYWVNTHPTDALGPGQIYPTHWMPLPAPPVAAKETP